MSNILNTNYPGIFARLSNDSSYDFYITNDFVNLNTQDDTIIFSFDFNDLNTFENNDPNSKCIISLTEWSGSTNTGYTFDTIGLCGLDNGFVDFTKPSGDTDNITLLNTLTGTTLNILSGDTKLKLCKVSGYTGNFVYPIEYVIDNSSVGNHINLCGGFYQGFFKVYGTNYEVFPKRTDGSWTLSMWLMKSDNICDNITGNTLNDLYPDNKGIFFYIGTRAENKFWNLFDGLNTGDTIDCSTGTTWCMIPKEKDIFIDDGEGNELPLFGNSNLRKITNKFLIYGRASEELSDTNTKLACNFTGDSIFAEELKINDIGDNNGFLYYYRNDGGHIACGDNIYEMSGNTLVPVSGNTEPTDLNLDVESDIINNGMCFMIRDDGSIGVRKIIMSGECIDEKYVTGCTKYESFSPSGVVKNNEWVNVTIKYLLPTLKDCDKETKPPRFGKLLFFVNCKLVHYIEDFEEPIFKELNTHWKKQIGVPFNISIGGGTQGLIENMTFDGPDPDDIGLCIEKHFAGSFIGKISQVKFYYDGLRIENINKICDDECDRYETCKHCV
jgi:hypothetical protein